jgi:hypothetical protein
VSVIGAVAGAYVDMIAFPGPDTVS